MKITLISLKSDIVKLEKKLNDVGAKYSSRTVDSSDIHYFNMSELSELSIAISSSGLLIAVSKVLCTFLKERKKRISVEIDGAKSILYSEYIKEKEILNILEKFSNRLRITLVEPEK